MPVYRLIVLYWLLLISQTALALAPEDFLPADQAFKLTASANSAQQVDLEWQIADGYHLYRDKTQLQSQTETIQLGAITMPEGSSEHDPSLGEVVVYRNNLKISVPLINKEPQSQLKLYVKYQGCADVGLCYPPQKVVLDIALPKQLTHANNLGNTFAQSLKSLTPSLFNNDLLPAEQAFQFFATVKDAHTLQVTWRIADGYYLYKNKLQLALDNSNTSLGPLNLPTGTAHKDEEFGDVEIYRQDLNLDVALQRQNLAAETIKLTAKFQGCADRGVCYPPMQSTINLDLPAAQALSTATTAAKPAIVSEQDRIVSALKQDTLSLTLLTFFGFGLLLAFTPCIFPMVPILSGIIVGHGDKISTRKGFLLSLSYVTAHALMYTLFGILAALFGSNLQAAFQTPWVIASFAALFVVLSFSMFGFYNLELPKTVQTMAILRSSSDKHRDGSYWGAGIMGAFSALIVGPCVAAPLAAALIYIGQTGNVLLGATALFAMGFGMGMPLLLLGASAGKILPKAGAWLNSTKSVFGVIMLGVAVWMLSRIVPVSVTMTLSACLLIISAIYLNALETLPENSNGWRKLWKGVGLILLIMGVLQLIGVSAGASNPLKPLSNLALAKTGSAGDPSKLAFQRVHTSAELDQKLQQARQNHHPVMLDFYADWCVACKELEAETFSHPSVQRQLSGYLLLQVDVTANSDDDKTLLKHFNLIGPPGIIFYDKTGRELNSQRVIGFQEPEIFLSILQQL